MIQLIDLGRLKVLIDRHKVDIGEFLAQPSLDGLRPELKKCHFQFLEDLDDWVELQNQHQPLTWSRFWRNGAIIVGWLSITALAIVGAVIAFQRLIDLVNWMNTHG